MPKKAAASTDDMTKLILLSLVTLVLVAATTTVLILDPVVGLALAPILGAIAAIIRAIAGRHYSPGIATASSRGRPRRRPDK
jgi:hypothetical protein